MAKTIDQRVVDLEFNNKQFQEGVGDSLSAIDRLKKGLQFKGATRGLEDVDRAAGKVDFGAMANGINTVTSRLSALGVIGFTVIQDLTRSVLQFGQNVANTLVLDPIKMGFSEYETKINAIQTILSNTKKAGVTMEDVTRVLDDLNVYADKTIYNFTEMTKNIGTFTAAGVELDVAADAIKGIANLAAVSGSNSQQASTAMYQLSQALSSGTLKLQDWNSVVNAGMGGQVFQDALKETARVHGIAVDEMIEQNGSFRESLQEGWITKDILTETLAKFTGDLTEAQLVAMGYADHQIEQILALGQDANDAATKVKTLTQLGETLQEAMQSGWTQSWELIIGDFEEARKVLTKVSDVLNGIIGASADARNSILKDWADSGRENLLNSFYNSLDAIQRIVAVVQEAFHEIFPPITAERLKALTWWFERLTEKFIINEEQAKTIKMVLKAFFAILDIGRMAVVDLIKVLGKMSGKASPVISEIKDFILVAAEWIINLRNSIKEGGGFIKFFENLAASIQIPLGGFQKFVDKIKEWIGKIPKISLDGITDFISRFSFKFEPLTSIWDLLGRVLSFIGDTIKKVAPLAVRLAGIMGTGISKFLDAIGDGVANFDPTSIFTAINSGLFGALLLAVKRFVGEGTGVLEGVGGMLEGVGDVLSAWQKDLQSKVLLRIAGAIAILAVSLLLLSTIDGDRLTTALTGMTVMIVELFGAMKAFSAIQSGISSLGTLTLGLLGVATALLIMSKAVVKLASLDAQQISRGMIAMAAMISLMNVAAKSLSQTKGQVVKGALSLVALAIALNVIAGAVYLLGNMKPEVLTKGLASIGVLLAELAIFIQLVGGSKGIIKVATGIGILSGALLVLTASIFLLGSMPVDTLQQGLFGMGAALLIVAGALQLMPKNMLFISAGLIAVGLALVLIGTVLKSLGGMTWEELSQGLKGLGIALIILVGALYAMQGTIAGSAALLVASVALLALAGAMKILGTMSLKEIGLALLAMAGTIVILGVAAYALTPMIPTLLAFAAAMISIGVATALVGAGVLLLSIGITALAASGGAGIGVLVLALTSVISLIPFIVEQIGRALIRLVQVLAQAAPELLEAVVKLLMMLIQAVIEVTPPLVDAILLLITTLLVRIADELPTIVQAGYDILLALLHGVEDNIGEIVETAYNIMINFIDAIGRKVPELIDAGWNMMINFIDGLAESAEKNIPRLMVSVQNLGRAIVDGILTGIADTGGGVFSAIFDLATGALDTFKAALGISSPSTEFANAGQHMIDGVVYGIQRAAPKAFDTNDWFAQKLLGSFENTGSDIGSAIEDQFDSNPVVTPVMDLSEIEKGSGEMCDMIKKTELTKKAECNAGTVMKDMKAQETEALKAQNKPKNPHDSKQATVQYVQNNYSPKALTPSEIYRLTKNQLKTQRGQQSGIIKMT